MPNKGILERLAEGVVLGQFTEQHHWNGGTMPMSDTEYNNQTDGREAVS